MRRREFIGFLGGAAVAGPIVISAPVAALTAGKIARVGLLTLSSPDQMVGRLAAFREGMSELGYREDQNIVYEVRFAEGRIDRLAALATELLQAKVDVIVPAGYPAIRAVQKQTKTLPIVVAIMSDPVEEGFAASYARPGGNITGLAFQDAETGDSERAGSVAFTRCRAMGSRDARELVEGDAIGGACFRINLGDVADRGFVGARQDIRRSARKQGAGRISGRVSALCRATWSNCEVGHCERYAHGM
jgi:ABC transporter substrate binding protein